MTTVTITRTVPSTLERAFTAFTDAETMASWWWPHLPDTRYELDPRVGGELVIDSPTAGIAVRGTYTEVAPPHRLAFTWIWVSDNETMPPGAPVDTVEVTFAPEVTVAPKGSPRTVVTVRHTSVFDLAGGGAEQGWNDCMDRLAVRE